MITLLWKLIMIWSWVKAMEYYEYIIDEILNLIKDNLILKYKYDDNALINIKEYCLKKDGKKYTRLDNQTLIWLAEDALADLINADYWYDFRDIE